MSHVRPDGDALGCTLAMGLCLRALGKDVTVWNEDGVPEKFRYLPGTRSSSSRPPSRRNSTWPSCSTPPCRTAPANRVEAVTHADVWINIDHHISNDHYGDLAYIDAARARHRADPVRALSRTRSCR